MTSKNNIFCTISSVNYAPQVALLAESLAVHSPDSILNWLVVDRVGVAVPFVGSNVLGLPVDVITIDNLEKIAYVYDVIEFNTVVKPSFLLYLFDRYNAKTVTYFDPDICVHSSLEWIGKYHEQSDVLLTPHAFSSAGLELDSLFLKCGVFNLGFVSFRRSVDSFNFLNWWKGRCLSCGFNDPILGVFVDQKWMNLAPVYVSNTEIIKDWGANVAFWNLHERVIGGTLDFPSANDAPLLFFHYSGVRVDPDGKPLINSHFHVPVEKMPCLQALIYKYAEGLSRYQKLFGASSYTFGHYLSGQPVHRIARKAYIASDFFALNESPFDHKSKWFSFAKKNGLIINHTSSVSSTTKGRSWKIFSFFWKRLPKLIGLNRYDQLTRVTVFLGSLRNQGLLWARKDVTFSESVLVAWSDSTKQK